MTVTAKWITGGLVITWLHLLSASALGGYPGTFYHIMMRMNRDRKNPRKAPSPNQLWAILDPPASLGSLGGSPLNTNRIIRSVDNYRENEFLRQIGETSEAEGSLNEILVPGFENVVGLSESEAVESQSEVLRAETEAPEAETEAPEAETEAPEAETEAPEAETEAPETETEAPEAEAEEAPVTEPPVITEAPIVCGGDLDITVDPYNTTIPDGLIFHEMFETPGWEDGEYPEDFECVWNINVLNDCMMGMMLFQVTEGHIRETTGCKEDFLKVTHNNGVESMYCGAVVSDGFQVSGTDIWTVESDVPRTTQLTFKSDIREGDSGGGAARGIQVEVLCYCWAFSSSFLSRTTTTGAPRTEQEESEIVVEEESENVVEEEPENVVEEEPENVVEEESENVVEEEVEVITSSQTNQDVKVIVDEEQNPQSEEEVEADHNSVLGEEGQNSLLGDGLDAGSSDLLIPDLVPIAPAGTNEGIGIIPFAPAAASGDVSFAPVAASEDTPSSSTVTENSSPSDSTTTTTTTTTPTTTTVTDGPSAENSSPSDSTTTTPTTTTTTTLPTTTTTTRRSTTRRSTTRRSTTTKLPKSPIRPLRDGVNTADLTAPIISQLLKNK